MPQSVESAVYGANTTRRHQGTHFWEQLKWKISWILQLCAKFPKKKINPSEQHLTKLRPEVFEAAVDGASPNTTHWKKIKRKMKKQFRWINSYKTNRSTHDRANMKTSHWENGPKPTTKLNTSSRLQLRRKRFWQRNYKKGFQDRLRKLSTNWSWTYGGFSQSDENSFTKTHSKKAF